MDNEISVFAAGLKCLDLSVPKTMQLLKERVCIRYCLNFLRWGSTGTGNGVKFFYATSSLLNETE